MTTLIYQCENDLSTPLDARSTVYTKKNRVNQWRNEGNLFFFPFGEKHLNGQNV